MGNDAASAYRTAAGSAMAAWRRPGVLEKTIKLPSGEMPGAAACGVQAVDQLQHVWDLAKATGRPYPLDPSLAATALEMSRPRIGPDRREAAAAQGWMRRAEKALADLPECPAHCELAFFQSMMAQGRGDLAGAFELADRSLAIAMRTGLRDKIAMSLVRKGRVLLKQGEMSEGMALLDEAMVAAVGGELSAYCTGAVYCATIDACQELFDRSCHQLLQADAAPGSDRPEAPAQIGRETNREEDRVCAHVHNLADTCPAASSGIPGGQISRWLLKLV